MISRLTPPPAIRALIPGQPAQRDSVGLSGASILLYPDRVLKHAKDPLELQREQRMMAWLAGRLPVPRLLHYQEDAAGGWLLMSRLPGRMASDPALLADPPALCALLSQALRTLWAVDTAGCPAVGGLKAKLQDAKRLVRLGLVDVDDAEPGTFGEEGFSGPDALLAWLCANQPPEDLVFSHGDFCLPNLLVDGGHVTGYIDLGRAGILDRWQDIALCWRSLQHSYQTEDGGQPHPAYHRTLLFEHLGLTPDWDKLRYYILLDELF